MSITENRGGRRDENGEKTGRPSIHEVGNRMELPLTAAADEIRLAPLARLPDGYKSVRIYQMNH